MTDNDKLFPAAYNISGTEYASQLQKDLQVNRQDLNGEFLRHAETYAWYATAYELALDLELRTKAELERLYAVLDHRVRMEAEMAMVKMTEKKVENSVITRDEYVTLQNKYFDATKNAALLKAARDAMMHKRDMLISLGANFRSETRADPHLLADEYQRVKSR